VGERQLHFAPLVETQQFPAEHLQMPAGLQAIAHQGTKTWIAIWDQQGSEVMIMLRPSVIQERVVWYKFTDVMEKPLRNIYEPLPD